MWRNFGDVVAEAMELSLGVGLILFSLSILRDVWRVAWGEGKG